MDAWIVELKRDRPEVAWDLFLGHYRRLIFATIRRYARDYDDVMDVFARVCEALRENDLRRLRTYVDRAEHRARFSTWLVTVVRNLTIDWFRTHHANRRFERHLAHGLPPLQQTIVRHVFVEGRSHVECYELIRTREQPSLSFHAFLGELRQVYRAVTSRRSRALLEVAGAPPAIETDAPDWNDLSETRGILAEMLSALTAEERLAVELYVLEELPAADVARIIGLPDPKAVYNRVYRALAAARAHLKQVGLTREDL